MKSNVNPPASPNPADDEQSTMEQLRQRLEPAEAALKAVSAQPGMAGSGVGVFNAPDYLLDEVFNTILASMAYLNRDLRIVRVWAGLEAATEDGEPIIGASPNAPGVFHVTGFTGHGFQLVPVTGAIIEDLVVRGQTSRDISGLQAARLMRPAQ